MNLFQNSFYTAFHLGWVDLSINTKYQQVFRVSGDGLLKYGERTEIGRVWKYNDEGSIWYQEELTKKKMQQLHYNEFYNFRSALKFSFHSWTAHVDLGILKLRFAKFHWVQRTTIGRTSLDEGSGHHREVYLCLYTQNSHTGKKSMTPVGFEFAIPESYRPQTLALNGSVNEIRKLNVGR